MKRKNIFCVGLISAMVAVSAVGVSAQVLTNKNWRVFNINVSEPKLWDIDHTAQKNAVNAGFDFNQVSSGWYSAYMNTNFGNLAGKSSVTMNASWTAASGSYKNRSGGNVNDAHVRFYFQSAEGNATSNDYWWSSDSCDLNITNVCALTVSLTDRTHWTNLCGQSATDPVPHPGANCIGGTDPAVSPYDGFTKALRNAKAGGVSFGGGFFYANGVAIADAFPNSASFHLDYYAINQ